MDKSIVSPFFDSRCTMQSRSSYRVIVNSFTHYTTQQTARRGTALIKSPLKKTLGVLKFKVRSGTAK